MDSLIASLSEKLLGRTTDTNCSPDEFAHLTGRRVMVTGAGGSIGSELVRQIVASNPSHVSLVELSEFNLYQIERHAREWAPHVPLEPLLADVRHTYAMDRLFEVEKPEMVFHAAALKHVPLLETGHNMIEGVRTNVLGTKNVADNCARHGVKQMLLVSTDKAVNPTSMMGVTKRCAELYVQGIGRQATGTHFVIVRFGNVMGSSGSVIPLFVEQALKGGPITLTHKDIVRYFMTIPEAVDLVLRASLVGMGPAAKEGAVYTLDMGAPVRIHDLAQQVIAEIGKKCAIEITGLRPGEKLYEELAYASETVTPTGRPGINQVVVNSSMPLSADWLTLIRQYADDRRGDDVLRLLKDTVPEYVS